MYSINFTVIKTKFCLSFHYNGANSYLFFNGTEIYKFKAKDSKTFSVDYDPTAVNDILDIHKYLIKKNNMI